MAEKEVERIYVVPLRAVKHTPVSGAAPRAIRQVQRFLSRHMKVELKDIWIDESVNHALWARGKYKIPSRIRVRAVKFDDGVVEVSLPEVEFKSFREELKTIKEAKEPILKREEEAEEEEGAEEKEETAEEGEGEKVAEEEVVSESPEKAVKETLSKEEKSETEEKPAEKEKPKESKKSAGKTTSGKKAVKTEKKK